MSKPISKEDAILREKFKDPGRFKTNKEYREARRIWKKKRTKMLRRQRKEETNEEFEREVEHE